MPNTDLRVVAWLKNGDQQVRDSRKLFVSNVFRRSLPIKG